MLREVGGERRLTDLRHIGEALHETAQREHLGLVSLLAWLREQVAEGRAGRGAERTRRLDSDAAAVQLVTIHASKGLQYPVVYLPALADRFVPKPVRPLFHDDAGQRCLDVGGPRDAAADGWGESVRRWNDEEAGEWLRLLYVAMTRAQAQVVCWWAPTKNALASPLHRLLCRPDGDPVVPRTPPVPGDDEVVGLFGDWAGRGGPAPEAALWGDPPPAPAQARPGRLEARRFGREVDTAVAAHVVLRAHGRPERRARRPRQQRRRVATSPGGAAGDAVGSEPESIPKDDEPATRPDAVPAMLDGASPAVVPAELQVASPMADLPVGATFGSLVHAVLEHADPGADDLRAELVAHVRDQLVWWPVDVDPEALADALVTVCDSPLGGAAPGLRLRDVGLRDRLREMDFELPLSGGDLAAPLEAGRPEQEVRLGDLAPLLRRHLDETDPVRGYAAALEQPALGDQPLRGYLTGSVDVVLRVAGDCGGPSATGGGAARPAPRYLVVDYKTNWLGPPDEPLTAHAYRPAALDAAMVHSDYPLQALLYAVVLHRFLRWRQPGYDPELHLGGVLYLYLRGMCGEATPLVDGEPCGVFRWTPPVPLLEAVSDLLDGARP